AGGRSPSRSRTFRLLRSRARKKRRQALQCYRAGALRSAGVWHMCASGKVRREVLGCDLRRWHPGCGFRDLRAEAMASGDVCCEIARLTPGQKHPVDLATETLWRDRSARKSGDRLGGCVRLLGGQAAVLYCEVGGVASGVDAVDP